MLPLSPDGAFNFELLRTLALSRYRGADIGEVLEAAEHIEPGNTESFHEAFADLASRVLAQADGINAKVHPVSARDAYFRAASYSRAADFFIHGNPDDPRISSLWTQQTLAFDKAIALLPVPGERVILPADGFNVHGIFFRADDSFSKPRPTLILGNGYDGAQEEMLHVSGFATLERGYNVIVYEGPGQPTIRRGQNKGFIHDWERAVTPVVDYLFQQPEVDSARIGLLGYSLGGYLSVRAAAFEHRLAAVIAVDGLWDIYKSFANNLLPPEWIKSFEAGDATSLNDQIDEFRSQTDNSTTLRWIIDQGLWSFNAEDLNGLLDGIKKMTLQGLEGQIQCPVYVGDAADDHFFQGQPGLVKENIGAKATLDTLTAADGAGHHCHVGAAVIMNQRLLDWFQDVVLK
jgi:dienelactone hydrolase